ncbi:hypothetical protein [Pseudomonas subflava]|uniref:hypothetical protein n=1 Tax=Pseudomonas subflava TaxID=2952933 RepID=UPI00207A381C|nr:hypothetical protein [Pseudomonas subflava]
MHALEKIRAFVVEAYGDEQARAAALGALDALSSNWQVVPKVATDEMDQAAFEAAGSPSDWYGFAEQWTAALAASPTP